jgi:hypothetical protein
MSGRRIDVTATQAVASMLAALTGAIAASSLGIAGTIIGAAFMSLASTVGSAVYKHYIARSNERLRAAASTLAPRTSGSAVAAAVVRQHRRHDPAETTQAQHGGAETARAHSSTTATWPAGPGADPHEDVTRTWFRRGPAAPGPADATAADAMAAQAAGSQGTGSQRTGSQRTGSQRSGSPAASPPATGAPRGRRRSWIVVALAAVGVFVVAMAAITTFEAIAGRPLESVVWQRQATGTTLGGLARSSPAHQRPGSPPGRTSSPRSAQPSTTPSNSGTPSPGPSTSASPSSPASPGSSPPPAPGTGASSRPAATRTPAGTGSSPAP